MANFTKIRRGAGTYLSTNIIISITVALFMFGLCALLVIQSQRLAELVKENIEIQVFLKKDSKKADIDYLEKHLSEQAYIKSKNKRKEIRFVPKNEAMKQLQKELGENFMEILEENPLRDAFFIKVKSELYENDKLSQIKEDLEKVRAVYEVSYVENMISEINKNVYTISLVFLIFGLFILITVIILIDNTIKLSLFSQRFLIRSMQLVGATDQFIQRPFLMRAIIQGSVSGLLAASLVFLFLKYMHSQIKELILLYQLDSILILTTFLIVLGSIVGFVSAYIAIKKYLKKSLDDLY